MLLIVAALLFSPVVWSQDKVSFRMNWYLGGLHMPFLYGKERGQAVKYAEAFHSVRLLLDS